MIPTNKTWKSTLCDILHQKRPGNVLSIHPEIYRNHIYLLLYEPCFRRDVGRAGDLHVFGYHPALLPVFRRQRLGHLHQSHARRRRQTAQQVQAEGTGTIGSLQPGQLR